MGADSSKALRFTHVRLRNWRNFAEVEVDLQQRAFVVGANASGKSNLLDVFRFLHDIVAVGGGFEAAVGMHHREGVSALRSLAAGRISDIVLHVKVGNETQRDIWEYELHFNQDSRKRPKIKKELIKHVGRVVRTRPDPADRKDEELLTQTHLQQVNLNRDFRPLAEFFGSVQYLHLVPQLVRDPDRSVGYKNDPYGGDFLEQVARTPERTRNSRLRRIKEALKVAVPKLQELELRQDVRGTPHLRGKYENWRARGAWQSEGQFSDGTLRLLGLLWALQEGDGPLLLEEPELSLHADVVRFIPQMFARVQRRSGRQIIVSTHSADILRDSGIGLDEVVLLNPAEYGTTIRTARAIEEAQLLLEKGSSLAEIVIPYTRPKHSEQLSLIAFW